MDPITALVSVAGPLIVHLGKKYLDDWWKQRGAQQGLIFNPQAGMRQVQSVSGTLSAADVTTPYPSAPTQEPPVTIEGGFLLEESLDWLRGDEIVLLLVFEAGYQAQGQVYLFEFDLRGYSLEIWPGDYFFYTLVLDPEASSLLNAEILALGYPCSTALEDPNPISVSGYGVATLDMILFDRLEFPDAPCFLEEIVM